jgi:hypothetical protein
MGSKKREPHRKRKRRAEAHLVEDRNRVLTEFGLLDLYRSFPKAVRQDLNGVFARPVRVLLTGEAAGSQMAREARERVREALAFTWAEVESDEGAVEFSVSDFWRYAFPVTTVLARAHEPEEMESGRIGDIWNVLVTCINAAMDALYLPMTLAVRRARIDRCLLQVRVIRGPHMRPDIELRATSPEEMRVEKAGGTTRAYRAFRASHVDFRLGPPRPMDVAGWPEDPTAGAKGEGEVPVFVESHALARMEERLDALPPGLAHLLLWESIERAEAQERRDGSLLVRYAYWRERPCLLGYLVARRRADCFLITTFLFATMEGTPEGERLRRALHASTLDLAQHELGRLSTYLGTDLLTDPAVRSLFASCGLGCLVAFRDEFREDADVTRGAADRFKDYFKRQMPKREDLGPIGKQLLGQFQTGV